MRRVKKHRIVVLLTASLILLSMHIIATNSSNLKIKQEASIQKHNYPSEQRVNSVAGPSYAYPHFLLAMILYL